MTINYHQQLKHPSEIIVGQIITRIGNTSFDIESGLFNNANKNNPVAKVTFTVLGEMSISWK